ncbi:uncharacterized protein LOC111619919 [Centruroides sculpturatus]|uniref:uncharacterized protein LOC111619919 n=1 Tax=Centruroides sculpturatus TaxID=218467 RepID=UPI000C6D7610|nr:uncharacterized protein LOC111619919 [Centruroides sculpturatus]XP_023217519.1 uncharacterized protein LOC111619919 [Centruroides sculpturatus]XP_023217525.1 uncharacterized protein LOC111619919 [Centruroides sculpturatus]XP_023217534.1 uncharacterized protein LOC111619919 [Centruroides sculpturatus]
METENSSSYSEEQENKEAMQVLKSERFENSFKDAVEVKKSWDNLFPFTILDDLLEKDSKLYENDEIVRCRRNSAKNLSNAKQWSQMVTGAFWEIVNGQEDKAVREFRKLGLYNSLYDFVHHIKYFETVKKVMEERGERVYIFGRSRCSIHDIDKLHPIMLVGYAEKFDDHKDTLLWQVTLEKHIKMNPHHQGNRLWSNENNYSDDLKYVALGEMICDKVSRRLQKDLKGKLDEDMWNVDIKYFDGLPPYWLAKALEILNKLKRSK